MVRNSLSAVLAQKKAVALEEIKEQTGGDSLVAVGEAMILRDEI